MSRPALLLSTLTSLYRRARSRPQGASRLAASFSSSVSRKQQKNAQPDTPATEAIELGPNLLVLCAFQPLAYVSTSHDPWFNLSFEDWLMRNTPIEQPVLFLYRNSPCVVIGRNQNPWKETTPRSLRSESVPLVRRRSGGGTVYHDLGNTNFSIILPRLLFTRSHGAELVARAIRERLGISQCSVNERNDVIIRDGSKELKVSGSAYKIIQHRAYHHGTMLISSSLAELGKSLKSDAPNLETKGIASFRSPVTTLNTYRSSKSQPIRHDDFVAAVRAEFDAVYGSGDKKLETRQVSEGSVKAEKVWKGVEELKTWEWQYGQTPEFSNSLTGELSLGTISATLTARHALITSLSLSLEPAISGGGDDGVHAFLDSLALALVGRRYESLEGIEGAGGPLEDARWRGLGHEVVNWLRGAM